MVNTPPTGPSPRAARNLLIGLGCVALALVLTGGYGVHRGLDTRSWTPVEGRVVTPRVRRDTTRGAVVTDEASRERQSTYLLELTYGWSAQGRQHVGSRVSLGAGSTVSRHPDRAAAEAAALAYRPGAPIPVYHDPADPAEAVLEPGLGWPFPAVLGLGLALSWLTVAGVRRERRRRREARA